MAGEWEAPAKLNLSLYVGGIDTRGMHPLRSLVLTVEWYDLVGIEESDEDSLEIIGAELPEGSDNIVWKAIGALRVAADRPQPRLAIRLDKKLPVAAGLGGGSSDAAASLLGAAQLGRLDSDVVTSVALEVGADVPFLLRGGLAVMEGYGERLTPLTFSDDFVTAIAVPPFEVSTGQVYRRFDELGEPRGPEMPARSIPPSLRSLDELRNDLQPAAVSIHPELADCLAELMNAWERPVAMSGSGPSLFGYFADPDEAAEALSAVPGWARARAVAATRRSGAAPADR